MYYCQLQSKLINDLSMLDDSHKRLENPHSYPVGIFSYTQSISHDMQIKLSPIKTLNETRNLVKNL